MPVLRTGVRQITCRAGPDRNGFAAKLSWVSVQHAPRFEVEDAELRRRLLEKHQWSGLTPVKSHGVCPECCGAEPPFGQGHRPGCAIAAAVRLKDANIRSCLGFAVQTAPSGSSRSTGSAARIRTIRMLSGPRAVSGATRAIRRCGSASDRDGRQVAIRRPNDCDIPVTSCAESRGCRLCSQPAPEALRGPASVEHSSHSATPQRATSGHTRRCEAPSWSNPLKADAKEFTVRRAAS